MAGDNKNSFRDMLLVIFVVLICFGITIYGIAYLTGKVFSSSPEPKEAAHERPKEVTTNPHEGDTLTFTAMNEKADEVMPDGDNILTTVTPPKQENAEAAQEEKVDTAPNQAALQDEKKEQKQAATEPKKQETATAKKETVKQEKPKQETAKQTPKKQEPKKEVVKTAPPAQNGAYVVQILAARSRESAEKEMAKYKAKYPDMFIKQVVIDGKTWYRVRFGVSATREQAQQKADKIANEFKIKPMVTKNN